MLANFGRFYTLGHMALHIEETMVSLESLSPQAGELKLLDEMSFVASYHTENPHRNSTNFLHILGALHGDTKTTLRY
jgi:hypothetical protein